MNKKHESEVLELGSAESDEHLFPTLDNTEYSVICGADSFRVNDEGTGAGLVTDTAIEGDEIWDPVGTIVAAEDTKSKDESAEEFPMGTTFKAEAIVASEVAVEEDRLEKNEVSDSENDGEKNPISSQGSSSRKKRAGMLAAAACLALLAIFLTSQAFSFLVREYPAKGSIKFDGVDIELIITTHDAAGKEVPAVDGEEIPTGEVHVDRSVYAKNTGQQPVWVRVKLGFAVTSQDDEQDISDLCTFAGGSSSWIKEGEWLYLDAPLEPGDTSPALITELTVDSQSAQDRYGKGGYTLTAQAGAVQSKHNATTVLDVEGWPE